MKVATRLKRLTGVALGIVALAAGGLFVAPYFVSAQEAQLAAMRTLRSATGVEPQIAGAVSFTLLPVPSVRIDDVSLDDGRRPAFVADSLRASVRLLPLLYGQVEIASLTFERPRLTVDVSDGGAIVVGLPLRPPGLQETTDVPEIRFVNGTVQFKSGNANRIEPLANVDAALARSGSGVTATGSFRWREQPASVSLSVSDLAMLEGGNRSGFRIRLEADEAKFGFDGGIAYRNGIQADGVIAAEAKSLRTVISHLARSLPITRRGFGPFKLKAQAAVASNSLALSGLTIELDGNRAEGGLTLKQGGAGTVVQATLASDSADFTPYSGGIAMTGEDGTDWSREPIDLAGLDGFDLDVRFSSSRVLVRKTELSRVAATATIRNGVLTVSVGDAQFHGGILRGRAMFGRNRIGDPEVKIDGSVANFDLASGFSALTNIQRLEGKGTLAVALGGNGHTVHAIARGLTGTATLTATSGALNGINVEQVLRRLERNPLSGVPDFTGGRTAFDSLNAKLRVTDGTARIEEARVASALVRVRLSGEASVVHRDFNLRGTATLAPTGATANPAQPFELSFLVRGPWDRPYLLPDPAALLRRSGVLGTHLGKPARHTASANDANEDRPSAVIAIE